MADLFAQSALSSADILPMTVNHMAFLVDRLHGDCSPLQFLRELTRNALEAIANNPDGQGEVRWDIDWNRHALTSGSVSKLCVIDTGCGMTGEEMVHYINKLSSSIHRQHTSGNYGVGAKISAAPANPHGLVYLSWKDGQGYMIHLMRDAASEMYGLLRFDNGEFWCRIEDDVKPEPIKDHGTMVVLLGHNKSEPTVDAPAKAQMPRKWILRYLNQRFFRFPKGVDVKAREGWDIPRSDTRHNFLRNVTGTESWLNESSEAKGVSDLVESGAKARWWILRADADLNSGHYPPGGHVSALYQNELYELVHGNAGIARLQSFGIVFGSQRVVIYIEPDTNISDRITSNTARTHLLYENEPLNWAAYAAEFRAKMPPELVDYQDLVGSAVRDTDHRTAIRERLKTIKELFRFGRYRPREGGAHRMGDAVNNSGGVPREAEEGSSGKSRSGTFGGRQGDIYALFAQDDGQEADQVMGNYEPTPTWVSTEDGTRSPGDMEDRAAKYLSDTGQLLINADFRAFTDMINRWKSKYDQMPGAESVIREVVREWFEQQLIETVMSAWGLKHGGKWSMEELAKLWSQESLTAAVLPRYHIDVNIKRTLGQKLGKTAIAA